MQLLLSCFWTVTVWPLLIFLTISRVTELRFKRGWSRWKAKTWRYKFSEGRRTALHLRQSKSLINNHLDCYSVDNELLLSRHWIVTTQVLMSRHRTVTVKILNCYSLQPLLSRHWTVIVQPLLSRYWIVIVRPLLRFLTISRVIELCFKRIWLCWKAKTRGYKFSEGRRTQFCIKDSQNHSSTTIWTVTVHLLLSCFWTVTVWPLIRFFAMTRVIELCFKRRWLRWKAKTRGYKFFEGRRTKLYI
jgi:hypothetical protein